MEESIAQEEREATLQEALEINDKLQHLRLQQLKMKNDPEVLKFRVLVDSTDNFRDRKKKKRNKIGVMNVDLGIYNAVFVGEH